MSKTTLQGFFVMKTLNEEGGRGKMKQRESLGIAIYDWVSDWKRTHKGKEPVSWEDLSDVAKNQCIAIGLAAISDAARFMGSIEAYDNGGGVTAEEIALVNTGIAVSRSVLLSAYDIEDEGGNPEGRLSKEWVNRWKNGTR